MKLDPDCIRDILLYVEDHTDLKNHLKFSQETIHLLFPQYPSDKTLYHIKQCELSGLFQKCTHNLDGDFYISYLSPDGHQFVNNIRSDNTLSNIKEIGKKVGTSSVSVLSQIASSVVTSIIQAQLGLT